MSMESRVVWLLTCASLSVPPPAARAVTGEAGSGAVAGKVVTASGAPAESIQVRLVDLRRTSTTDASGGFRFEDVPPGQYLVEAASHRHGRSVTRVEVLAGVEARVDVTLDVDLHHESIVVTAQPDARSSTELAQPVAVLGGDELRLRMEPTLGETLAQLPGVSSTYFGPGASRPIIRGIGGDRIRILEDGIGTSDVSSVSPDHAVAFDPIGADKVEVVRGPATLLYGSSAVGGVVNTIDKRIPDATSDRMIGGVVDLAAGWVSEERSGAAALQVGRGPLIVRGDYARRETEDLKIPGFAESAGLRAAEAGEAEEVREQAPEEAFGRLPNSTIESESGSASAAYVGRHGFLGVSARSFDTLYGVPGGHGHEDGEGGEEGPVRIDLEQRRVDLRAGYTRPFGAFRAAKLRFGMADYRHVELEGDEIGTTFSNDAWEGRIELLHRPAGSLTGSFGAQFLSRDFQAVGAEAFVPPTETRSWAVFAFEEIGRGSSRGQLGLRFESQDADALGEAALSRSFNGLSGSAGFVWSGRSGLGVALTLARSVKLPNAEELYSNGPHVATRAFEVGDPDLEKETSLGFDFSVRKRSGRFSGELSVFANRFGNYIFEELTGEEEDGLPVVQFVQKDARFVGAEVEAHIDLFERDQHHVDLELSGDLVRARLTDDGRNLPRIPPARYGVALHYGSQSWNARVEVRGALEQDRIAAFELPTEGYTFLNASLGYRLFIGRSVLDFVLRGTNLTDREGRVHPSLLKDLVPLPGRDVRLSARLTF